MVARALIPLAAAALLAPASAAARPVVSFVDVAAGPAKGGPGGQGVPIAIFGHGLGRSRGASRVTIGGREVARYLSWGTGAANPRLGMIVVQPGPGVRGGRVVVTLGGAASAERWTFRPTGGRVLAVAPDGVDTAPCTLTRPCRTIQHAIDAVLRPGDALLVRGGPVADDEVWFRAERSATAARPITVRNYPGERPLFAKATRPVIVEASHVHLSGFDFTGGKSAGLGNERTTDTRIVNSTFRGVLGYDAVGTHGDDVLVAGNVCDVSGSTVGTQGHCYYISHGRRIRLLENVGRGVPGYPVHIFDQQRSADDFRREIADVLVQGNVLSASTERSGLIVAMGDEGGRGNRVTNVRILGNTISGNNHTGIRIGGNVRGVRIERNRLVQNGLQGVTVDDDPTIADVRIAANLITQASNGVCRSNCTWYRPAHVEVGARTRGVTLAGNRYGPGARVVLGAASSG